MTSDVIDEHLKTSDFIDEQMMTSEVIDEHFYTNDVIGKPVKVRRSDSSPIDSSVLSLFTKSSFDTVRHLILKYLNALFYFKQLIRKN